MLKHKKIIPKVTKCKQNTTNKDINHKTHPVFNLNEIKNSRNQTKKTISDRIYSGWT